MKRTDLIPRYIIACCVLHNMYSLNRDENRIPIPVEDNNMLVELDPLDVHNAARNEGILKRQNSTLLLNAV